MVGSAEPGWAAAGWASMEVEVKWAAWVQVRAEPAGAALEVAEALEA